MFPVVSNIQPVLYWWKIVLCTVDLFVLNAGACLRWRKQENWNYRAISWCSLLCLMILWACASDRITGTPSHTSDWTSILVGKRRTLHGVSIEGVGIFCDQRVYRMIFVVRRCRWIEWTSAELRWVKSCRMWIYSWTMPSVNASVSSSTNRSLHTNHTHTTTVRFLSTPDRSANPAQHHRRPIISCDCRTCMEQSSYQHHSIKIFAIFQETT